MDKNRVVHSDDINRYITVEGIKTGSIADELGLEVGDKLIKINGQAIKDFIDYKFLLTDTYLEIEVIKQDGEYWILEIEKDYDDPLGIEFSEIIFNGLKECYNNCIFCFVNQAPPKSRDTLNLKDDDYRFSFLEGSYTTLTNLSKEEFNRIKRLHLSPLNISVHSTDPEVREEMLNNKNAGQILSQIKELVDAGIELNTQVVLCPGINDGEVLEKTIKDLGQFLPSIKSLAIVPVGLTKYREGLYNLRSFTVQEAKKIINMVEKWQARFRDEFKMNFVYLSDEFYLLAKESIPSAGNYDGFPQLENGIGLARLLLDDFNSLEEKLPKKLSKPRKVSLVTGELGAISISPIVSRLNQIKNVEVKIIEVENKYFGPDVTVTGLLTGQDILAKLKEISDLGDEILIPDVLLNNENLFLDDLSWKEFISQVPQKAIRVENKALNLVEAVLGIYFGGDGNGKTSSCNCR